MLADFLEKNDIKTFNRKFYLERFTLLWSKVKMSKDKNAEKINVENKG